MVQTITRRNIDVDTADRTRSAYRDAELGFRNYWYPVFSSREVTVNPRRITICGDNIVFLRRQGKAL